MKKLINLFIIIVSFSLAGCYKTKGESQMQLNMNPGEKEILMQQCEEMKSYGDIMQLLAEIKTETNEVLRLLEEEDMRKYETRITELADSIDKKSYAVIALSKGEWVDQRWDFEAKWSIDKNDFKGMLGTHINKFKITDADLQKIFFHGEERRDLLKNVTVTQSEDEVLITYKNRGSSLELCQLHKTLMILLDVNYKNVINNSHRFFNLTLDY